MNTQIIVTKTSVTAKTANQTKQQHKTTEYDLVGATKNQNNHNYSREIIRRAINYYKKWLI